MFDLNKTIIGGRLYVSENWITNGSFAIKKILCKNIDDFYSEDVFKRLKTYKGTSYDFNKKDKEIEQYLNKDFSIKYIKSNWQYKKDNVFYTLYESNDSNIFISSNYSNFFNLDFILGDIEKKSIVFVDNKDNTNLFVCETNLNIEDNEISRINKTQKILLQSLFE